MQEQPQLELINYSELIKSNKFINLSTIQHNTIIDKIKYKFTDNKQKYFLLNFYMYINNDPKIFNIDLEHIVQPLGLSNKGNCKTSLIAKCIENEDYIIQKINKNTVKGQGGSGLNKEIILLSSNGFKRFCLSINTPESREIKDYYIALEEIINEITYEQAPDLVELLNDNKRLHEQLQLHQEQIQSQQEQIQLKDEELSQNEQNIVSNLGNKNLMYVGQLADGNVKGGIAMAGQLIERIRAHKRQFGTFILKFVVPSDNYTRLENIIKNIEDYDTDSPICGKRYSQIYNGKNATELFRIDNKFTLNIFRDEIERINYYYCKFNVIEDLQKETYELKQNIITIIAERDALKIELKNLKQQFGINEPEAKPLTTRPVLLSETTLKYCMTNGHYKDPSEFGINPSTGELYSNCFQCRETIRLKNEENGREKREQAIEKSSHVRSDFEKHLEQILTSMETQKCVCCEIEKLPVYFDYSTSSGKLYVKCLECSGKPFPVQYTPVPEGFVRCSDYDRCCDIFPYEKNPITKKPFERCKPCRDKDLKHSHIKKDRFKEQKNQQNIPCSTKGCLNILEKDLTKKKDSYYQTCRKCRGIEE